MADALYQTQPTGPIKPPAGSMSASVPSERGIASDLAAANTGVSTYDKWALGLGGISDFIDAGSIYTRGNFEAAQLELNARLLTFNINALKRDIKDISYITGIQASNVMKTSAEMKGKQLAAQAESGFSVNETESFHAQLDFTDLLAKDQIDQYAYEAAMAIEGKQNQIAALKAEQKIKKYEASYARKAAMVSAGVNTITGAAKLYAGITL